MSTYKTRQQQHGSTTTVIIENIILAIFIFLIPRLYFGQSYEDFCRPDGKQEDDYWLFQQKTLPTVGSKLSWLWYLPALFIDCILTYPLPSTSVNMGEGNPQVSQR